MADHVQFRDFTRREKAQIAAKTARMTLPRANITRLRRDIERIEQQAARRLKQGK